MGTGITATFVLFSVSKFPKFTYMTSIGNKKKKSTIPYKDKIYVKLYLNTLLWKCASKSDSEFKRGLQNIPFGLKNTKFQVNCDKTKTPLN